MGAPELRPAMLNRRDPSRLSRERFDLIVVGGGVYGAMIALEAVRRGLRPLLLERADFAGATSANSLRIIHGGLRYLQDAHLARYFLSVRERAWFLKTFPDYTQPLPVLMALHGKGLRRRSVFRCALAVNNALTRLATAHLGASGRLPSGRTLPASAIREIMGSDDLPPLEGGALWHDAFVPCAPALVVETLRWACGRGASVLNYVEAREPLTAHGKTQGVKARDHIANQDVEFQADVVINAAGPWARSFAERSSASVTRLPSASLAWNLVLRRRAWTDHALAVTPPYAGAQTYFLVPWKGVLLAGTGHAPWPNGSTDPRVSADLLERFIDDLNRALPGLQLSRRDVAWVLQGLMPASRPGSRDPAKDFVIVDHGEEDGPNGLLSVSGVKFTEARAVADAVLHKAFSARQPIPYEKFPRPCPSLSGPDYAFDWIPDPAEDGWLAPLREIIHQEGVEHLTDLMFRRSSLGDNPDRALRLAPRACELFGWDTARVGGELAAMQAYINTATGHLYRTAT
jgi:glycerol-3-phosphate dehydrogenase